VLDNDVAGIGQPLSISEVGDAPNGTTRIDGDEIVYTPDSGFVGTDRFDYTIREQNGGTAHCVGAGEKDLCPELKSGVAHQRCFGVQMKGVPDLVSEYAGHLFWRLGGGYETFCQHHAAARKRECVDQPPVNHNQLDVGKMGWRRDALAQLGMSAKDLIRKGESRFKELGLAMDNPQEVLLAAMAAHPILIERPIVFAHGKAAIGRPPEAVLDIL